MLQCVPSRWSVGFGGRDVVLVARDGIVDSQSQGSEGSKSDSSIVLCVPKTRTMVPDCGPSEIPEIL